MSDFWNAAPSEAELDLWWLVEAEGVKPPAAAIRLGVEAERAEEAWERVEAFLQAGKQAAEAREEPLEGPRRLGEDFHAARVEYLFAEAASATLKALRERQRSVRVHETDGVVEKIVFRLERKRRPPRMLLRLLKDLLRSRRERIAALADAARRTRDRVPAAPRLRIRDS